MAITPKETKDAHKIPKPAQPEFENHQLNLFQNFLCNSTAERDQLSNAIDLWDNIPRYSISRRAMDEARINGLFLKSHRADFQYKGRSYIRTITPARVEDLDGKEREYYASANEELIEDALRKIATEQFSGYFDKPNYSSGVLFTLYMLRQELKRRGHTRSYQEIVLGLRIMHHSNIEIAERNEQGQEKLILSSPYVPVLAAVSRGHLRDDPKAKWMVQFHPFVTGSIDQVTYRQFNYHLMMSHSTQLARWLHKQLFHDAGAFMAEHRGRGMGPQALDEMQIAMAHAGGHGAHQHFVFSRLVDVDLLDRQRFIGTVKNCSFHMFAPQRTWSGPMPGTQRHRSRRRGLTIAHGTARFPARLMESRPYRFEEMEKF